jgi:hypothetical protein
MNAHDRDEPFTAQSGDATDDGIVFALSLLELRRLEAVVRALDEASALDVVALVRGWIDSARRQPTVLDRVLGVMRATRTLDDGVLGRLLEAVDDAEGVLALVDGYASEALRHFDPHDDEAPLGGAEGDSRCL